jgi:hypothetical protein
MTKTEGKLRFGSAYIIGLHFVTLFVSELRIINAHTSARLHFVSARNYLCRQQFLSEAALRAWWYVFLLPVLGSCYNQDCKWCCPSCLHFVSARNYLRRQQFLSKAALRAWWYVCLLPVLGSCYNQDCKWRCPSCLHFVSVRNYLCRQQFLSEAALRAWWWVCLLPVLGSCYNQACLMAVPFLSWRSAGHELCLEVTQGPVAIKPNHERCIRRTLLTTGIVQ